MFRFISCQRIPGEHWDREGVGYAPPVPKATADRSDSSFSGPFRDIHRNAVQCDLSIASRIIRLLRLGCPAAIAWFIAAIVILALDFESRLVRRTHIRKEIPKIVPTITDVYSPAAIISVCFASWVVAAPTHSHPNAINATLRYGEAVRAGFISEIVPNLISVASAGSAIAFSQGLPSYNVRIAAITEALPYSLALIISFYERVKLDHAQSSETLSGKILTFKWFDHSRHNG